MTQFKYDSPGDIYVHNKLTTGASGLSYRRFKTGAEAIRFVMEHVPSAALSSCTLKADGQRFGGKELRELYESSLYPLPRARTSRKRK
jgi:hypothetical protein